MLCAENNLAAGSVTLVGSVLTPLLQDAIHYLDGAACCTVVCCHTEVSTHSAHTMGMPCRGVKTPPSTRPKVKQPSNQYCTLAHCSAM